MCYLTLVHIENHLPLFFLLSQAYMIFSIIVINLALLISTADLELKWPFFQGHL